MSTSDLEYAHPTDDLRRLGDWTVTSGTTAATYGIERLMNNDPAYPCKFDTTTFRIEKDFGSAVVPKYAAIIHANFQLGYSDLLLQGNSSASWGSPAFSIAFPAAAYHEDGFPINLAIDLRETGHSFRYWSLVANTANSVPIAIGAFVLVDTLRSLDGHLLLDASPEDDEEHPSVDHATDAGVETILSYGTRLRWLRGDKFSDELEGAQLRAWHRAAQGKGIPFLLLPHLEDDEPWIARWTTAKFPRVHKIPESQLYSTKLEFAEVSRGLMPTPSAV